MGYVWVLTAAAPDNPGVVGVYATPEAAHATHPGVWKAEAGGWSVAAPAVDHAYGGWLERWEVQSQ